uniref:Saposin B-type domain-containing protein n=1 Tax=Rhabditophanes sp. KR3021 TaxID=114890 RepID=A0AC35U0U8_9BILA
MSKFVIVLALCILAVTNILADPTACAICQQVIVKAESNFKNGEPESTLLTDLTRQCYAIAQPYGTQAITTCLQIVNTEIDKIYSHFQAGMSPCTICTAAQSCVPADACGNSEPGMLPETMSLLNSLTGGLGGLTGILGDSSSGLTGGLGGIADMAGGLIYGLKGLTDGLAGGLGKK